MEILVIEDNGINLTIFLCRRFQRLEICFDSIPISCDMGIDYVVVFDNFNRKNSDYSAVIISTNNFRQTQLRGFSTISKTLL
jgi:hypothetical protein